MEAPVLGLGLRGRRHEDIGFALASRYTTSAEQPSFTTLIPITAFIAFSHAGVSAVSHIYNSMGFRMDYFIDK